MRFAAQLKADYFSVHQKILSDHRAPKAVTSLIWVAIGANIKTLIKYHRLSLAAGPITPDKLLQHLSRDKDEDDALWLAIPGHQVAC